MSSLSFCLRKYLFLPHFWTIFLRSIELWIKSVLFLKFQHFKDLTLWSYDLHDF